MSVKTVNIILNGVTGRMGTNQHLVRSILAIIQQGGIKVSDRLTLMPAPILTGRNEDRLKELAEKYPGPNGPFPYTTNLDGPLGDQKNEIFFDASGTLQRAPFVEMAVKAKKSIYCEKPTAVTTAEALRLAKLAEKAKLKNGVVQDKLWLPGFRKMRMLNEQGFFGRLISVRGEFGYWVFTGHVGDQPAQRPSWNYRNEDGGGIITDMLCHWRYLVDNLFGPIKAVSCVGATLMPERVDERGGKYTCTADDGAYATFELESGVMCHFNSSWCVRVRRDDLLTVQADGTEGTAVSGLRKCWTQHHSATPRCVWNPDIDSPINHFNHWQEVPDAGVYDNAFKVQWELFIRHVVLDEPFRWTLREGAKGVQLAELGIQSWKERRWIHLDKW
jgi:predicted dehydrogenase